VKYLTASSIYWFVFWIGVAFLVAELGAEFNLLPLDTFSKTVQLNEKLHPWLKPIVFGFGVGLVAHLVYGTLFWKSLIAGGLIALAVHFLLGLL
jgi:uncharacterized membrane protein YagU involved in acid resistance